MVETTILPSTLKLPDMANILSILRAALEKGSAIELSIPDNATADLSFVQLIESAIAHAKLTQRKIRLASPSTGSVLKILETGGFLEPGSASVEFWQCGEQM